MAKRVDDLALSPKAMAVVSAVRERLLAIPTVEERVIVDDGDLCPAYYFRGRQLCHLHVSDRIGATVPLNTRYVVPRVLADAGIPPEVRKAIDEAGDFGGTRWVSIPLGAAEATAGLVAVLLCKIRFLESPPPRGLRALPREQRTLEGFR